MSEVTQPDQQPEFRISSPPAILDAKADEIDIPVSDNRIFLNHVDQYNARHIAEFLVEQEVGALKHGYEVEGEGDDPNEISGVLPVVEKYECIGTVKFRFGTITEDIAYTVSEADQKLLEKHILTSGAVIFDISNDMGEIPKALNTLKLIIDEIESIKSIGPKTYQRYDRVYVFILISSVLSWSKTKPIDQDDPEIPFTEADYKKRKASTNYQEQIACEREVVLKGRKYKDNLKTYVVCCGIPYGFEEDNLNPFFRMAWENQDLPIVLPGNNYIPLIHIQDVAKVIHAILELKPKKQYILVVEQVPCRLGKIMRALAAAMGKGVKEIVKEDAFLHNSITQKLYDIFTINLKMEPAYILDTLELEYRSDLNMVQNMKKIVMEFRDARNLIPMKVLVHGPVASGRTHLSTHLTEYYGVHYINVKTMIEETRENWRHQIDAELQARKMKSDNVASEREEYVGEEEDEEYEPVVNLDDLQEKLATLETTLEHNDNVLPDEFVIQLMRQFLASNICQNQGYVLDAYPKTMSQCVALFGPELNAHHDGGEGEGEEEDYDMITGPSIAPQFVISLEADNEYLIQVMMNYPEQGKEFEEENMMKRLQFFRDNNTEENSLLNFFDEHEIHPIIVSIMNVGDMKALYEKVHDALGLPIGFEPSPEEQEEVLRCQQQADELKEEQKAIDRKILECQALEQYQEKMEERIRILDELQKEEESLLQAQCEPLRHYLMMHVFPTLTHGLLEIAKIKPDDPIDYLAEYLFKFNPEGKMFDPTFTRRGKLIQNEAKNMLVQKASMKTVEDDFDEN